MKKQIEKLLEPLVNLPTEYAIKGHCAMCGFPMDKDYRIKKVTQATSALIDLFKEKMLEIVGEDRKLTQHYDGFDNGFDTGCNQAKAEIIKKINQPQDKERA